MLEDRQDAGLQARGRAVSLGVCRALLAAVIVVLVVGAYYPFSWDPVRPVRNQVTRTDGGALRFGTMNEARTPGTPGWLAAARRTGSVEIQLEAESGSGHQVAPMMMLASDTWHVDFAIAQTHAGLGVRLLRPGSLDDGWPSFGVRGVLHPHQWSSVDVLLSGDRLRIAIDGRTRLVEPIPGGTLRTWRPGQIALGDAVHGGTPWQGEIRLAEVRTGNYTVNYVSPGALSIPRSYWYLPDHIEPFPPTRAGQWELAFLDLLTFIPAGFLISWSGRPPIRPVPATLLAAALAVLLAAGKILFADRHTSVANVIGQVIGGLIGALVACWLARRMGRPGPQPHHHGQHRDAADRSAG